MRASFYKESIEIMRRCWRPNQDHEGRPIFIFACGGREDQHTSRRQLRDFIASKRSLTNVLCLSAEAVAKRGEFQRVDLLTQEAMMADIADWLVIFSESAGSICELGAFAALPHARAITSIVEDSSHAAEQSFLNDGPIRMIHEEKSPLSRLFVVSLSNIMMAPEFTRFVTDIRSKVQAGSRIKRNEQRMRPNSNNEDGKVYVGPLVHELIDIISLLGPIDQRNLFRIYCDVLGIKLSSLSIRSRIIQDDISENDISIKRGQVMAFMAANSLVKEIPAPKGSSVLYTTRLPLSSYFMFRNSKLSKERLHIMKAKVLGQKRHMGMRGANNVYHRHD